MLTYPSGVVFYFTLQDAEFTLFSASPKAIKVTTNILDNICVMLVVDIIW